MKSDSKTRVQFLYSQIVRLNEFEIFRQPEKQESELFEDVIASINIVKVQLKKNQLDFFRGFLLLIFI